MLMQKGVIIEMALLSSSNHYKWGFAPFYNWLTMKAGLRWRWPCFWQSFNINWMFHPMMLNWCRKHGGVKHRFAMPSPSRYRTSVKDLGVSWPSLWLTINNNEGFALYCYLMSIISWADVKQAFGLPILYSRPSFFLWHPFGMKEGWRWRWR